MAGTSFAPMPRTGAGAVPSEPSGQLSVRPAAGDQLAVYDERAASMRKEQAEREQAELEFVQAAIGTVFSTRKPRDAVAGTASGLKTMARGVGLGLTSLVAAPYIGAKTAGAKGFVKGVGAGLAACTASTVAGTLVGSGQIVRGFVNTPGAILHKAQGQVWNAELRRWEKDWYSLPEEAAEILGPSAASSSSADGAGEAPSGGSSTSRLTKKKVADTELYDILGVTPDASEAELRRAFYKKSLALHPDKNPNNPEATHQFQAVSDAYRILSDEDRRRAYDEHGKDSAAAGLPKIEPMVFFAALFGTHHFEPYVGRLRLALDIDSDMQSLFRDLVAVDEEEGPNLDPLKVSRANKKMKAMQCERQVKCAVTLAKRLEAVVNLPKSDRESAITKWEAELRSEAKTLEQTPCGAEMLYLIGWLYCNGASQYFAGNYLSRMLAKAEAKVHVAKSKAQLAGTVGRTCITVNGLLKKEERKKKDKESKAAAAAAPSPPSTDGHAASQAADNPQDSASSSSKNPSKENVKDSPRPAPQATAGSDSSDAPKPQKESLIAPGSVVVLCNLRNSPELNDQVGVVSAYEADSERYVVHIMSERVGARKLKRENLIVIEDTPSDYPSECPEGPSAPDGKGSSEEKGGQWAPGEENDMEVFKDTMPLLHDTLWSITTLDVEFTLANVIQKVLRDMSVDKSVRQQRAEGLNRIGKIFQEPLKERKAQKKEPKAEALKELPTSPSSTSVGDKSSRSSMLARFKPSFSSFRFSSSSGSEAKAKLQENKIKQMEAALALMAAGASTDDVDEMLAARAAMEAEMENSSEGHKFPL